MQPYKYNGKELDQMHGLNLYDYSARYYESAIGRFTSVDPLAEKYYSISPYAYCANNPIKFIDPTGMEIWIYYEDEEGNEQKMLYTAGMSYEGKDNFVSNIVTYLNAMNETEAGASLLTDLINSENPFDFTNTETSAGGNTFQFDQYGNEGRYKKGGGEIHAAAIGSKELRDIQKMESLSHELFHGYQRENGCDPATINAEVEAYLYGRGISMNSKYALGGYLGFGNETLSGKIYDRAMSNLLYGQGSILVNMGLAIINFKSGSTSNNNNLYKNTPISIFYKYQITKFLPF